MEQRNSGNSIEVGYIWSITSLLEPKHVSSYEPKNKQESTGWIFQNELEASKVVRSRSAAKQMIACFFGYTGYVTTVEKIEGL